MAALPYIPLYIADYLADTSHLSTLEHGAYLLLIMNYWQRGGPIPCSDLALSRIAKVPFREWQLIKPLVGELFHEIDGKWHHKRIEIELEKVRSKSIANSRAGKLSAKNRSQRALNVRSTSVEQTIDKRSTGNERTFNHTDTDTDTEKKDTLVVSSATTNAVDDKFQEFWNVYPQRLGDRGKKAASKSYRSAIKRTAHEQIMRGVKAYADFCVSEEKINTPYVKLAATWLNQDGWTEDYISADPKLAKAEAARRAIEAHNAKAMEDRKWD